ncbi:MAG TPA: DUF1573 domain-containing protein [Flavobacteriales bacterium]|nr:DUF1573 domain-containing protein [Flavobacteriales bacterium]
MKENIKIALLGIIAVGVVFIAVSQREQPAGPATFAPLPTAKATPASPVTAAPQNTFDPITPPAAPPEVSGPSTTISFAQSTHDFGKIMQDSENTYRFKFTNTGKEPLVITNVQASCGCTAPNYPKHPIKPGESDEILVEYRPGKQEGMQNKTVTVTANTEPSQTILSISANVLKSM